MKIKNGGTSPVVQWLRLHAPNAGGQASIPGQGTKMLKALWHSQKNKIVMEKISKNQGQVVTRGEPV